LFHSTLLQPRYHGVKGKRADFESDLSYLKKYRPHMGVFQWRASGEPIGGGITEAGCKVIWASLQRSA
jgi:hypothetical protein